MGATTPNGVISQVPYGLLKNVNFGLLPVTILIFNTSGNPRNPIHSYSLMASNNGNGVPFYLNETIKLVYCGPNQSASAQVCDLWRVNPTTGVETLDTTVSLNAVRQKSVNILVTAINAGSGALTTTVTYDV